MFVVKYSKIWLSIGIFFVVLSIFSFLRFGLNLGVDFIGGSVLELSIDQNPSKEELQDLVKSDSKIDPVSITKDEDKIYKLEFKALSQEENDLLIDSINKKYGGEDLVKIISKYTISPSIGQELQQRAVFAVIMVLITMILFITYVFKGISYPVPSFYYGLVAIVALFHDIIIPIGVFSYLSYLKIVEIDTLFIIALLSILGASVNDTIVIFDRIRENIRKLGGDNFEKVVAKSIEETLTRSINTTLTILFILGSIIFLGGESVRFFALALFVGMFFGTYSSIFLASPMLLYIYKTKFKNK